MNTHPVRIALVLKEHTELLENIATIVKILELMSEREFTNRRDVNEVLSLKYHIIHYIVKDIKKQKDKAGDNSKTPFIDLWIKSMLVGRETDGYPVFQVIKQKAFHCLNIPDFMLFQENFLRQGIKEFPFKESQLFKTLVTNFHHSQNYGEGMTAAEFINQAFNGQKGFKDDEDCSTCGNEKAQKKCSNCKSVQYCNQSCQKYHWFVHKKLCAKIKEAFEAREKSKPVE